MNRTNGMGRTTHGDGTGGGKKHSRKPKQPSFKDVVLQFIGEQRQFNAKQEQFNKKQEQVNEEHREAIIQLNGKVDKIDEKLNNVIELNNLKS
ncbi:MAG: hypothetical protein LBB45_06965 [Methanobrevibacter sp.]|nr:hypothetical protein [Candidatus Methanovirga basalitermitum]